MTPSTPAEQAADLSAFAGLAEDLAHRHLGLAVDHNGKPAIVLSTDAASHMYALIREIARRGRELEAQL